MTRLLVHALALGTLGVTATVSACSSGAPAGLQTSTTAATDGGAMNAADASAPASQPLTGSTSSQLATFTAGQAAFNHVFGEAEGLGPLYTKTSCADCHQGGARGPGVVAKMAVVGADGLTPTTDQSLLPFGDTEHPEVVTDIPGAHTPIVPPFDGFVDAGAAGVVSVRVTNRLGPPLYGRGYMEAIEDSEILRVEAVQAPGANGIHGRVNHVTFASSPNPDSTYDSYQTGQSVIGRFGMKARIATLDDFAADALQNDMGLTSPMRTAEFANPDGVLDDLKPGVDLTADDLNARAMYARLLEIPPRLATADGKSQFWTCACVVCHVPSLHTRSDYPIAQLADIDAPLFTDMLLHDMGDQLADGVAGGNEGEASFSDWRTAPLVGMRFSSTFLHDGRAATVEEAILLHAGPGSEANAAIACYDGLAPSDQQLLLTYVNGL